MPKFSAIHRAKVNLGNLLFDDPLRLRHDLQKYEEGTTVEVSVRKLKRGRSYSQNAYYWAVPISMMSDVSGMEAEEVHQFLIREFLSVERTLDNNKTITTNLSTSALDTVAFEEYLSRVRQFASEFFGIFVPKPNEVMYD